MKKKGILSFSIFLILVIAIVGTAAAYCWPVSRVWFPEQEKLEVVEVYVYENGIVEQLPEKELQSICQLLTGLKTQRSLGHSGSYCMDDYPVSMLLAYDLGSADQYTCTLLLGRTKEICITGGGRLYRIEDGDVLQRQLTDLLSSYYE